MLESTSCSPVCFHGAQKRSAPASAHLRMTGSDTSGSACFFGPKLTRTGDDEESEKESVNPHRGAAANSLWKEKGNAVCCCARRTAYRKETLLPPLRGGCVSSLSTSSPPSIPPSLLRSLFGRQSDFISLSPPIFCHSLCLRLHPPQVSLDRPGYRNTTCVVAEVIILICTYLYLKYNPSFRVCHHHI